MNEGSSHAKFNLSKINKAITGEIEPDTYPKPTIIKLLKGKFNTNTATLTPNYNINSSNQIVTATVLDLYSNYTYESISSRLIS